jgi:hypothetical protein
MENIFLIAGIVSVIFLIVKFIEMRFIEKENKPLKFLIRDSLIVYISVISGFFIINQVEPIVEGSKISSPVVFTDHPSF